MCLVIAASLLQQPTFRTGTNLVQVDVIVTTADGQPAADLTKDDFEILDEGRAVPVSAFKFVNVADGEGHERYPVRSADDEEREASRDDSRLFAILIDDYHIAPRVGPMRLREPLTSFIRSLGPSDLAAIYYPMESPHDVRLTYDRAPLLQAIDHLEGRWHEYFVKWPAEEEHLRHLPDIERLRTQVVLGALTGIATRLGELKVGRKTLLWITEGPTPYGGDPRGLQLDIDEVLDTANRNNVAIYPVDPRGLTTLREDFKQDMLKTVAFRTSGRAIVNRNNIHDALLEVSREARAYYLLGFESPHPADGKFHAVTVRTKRPRVTIAARSGYWALTEAELASSRAAPIVVPAEVNDAMRRLADKLRPVTDDLPAMRHAPPPPAVTGRVLAAPTIALVRGAREPEPVTRPEFLRSQRIVVRAALVGTQPTDVVAQLLDRLGRPLTKLPVTSFAGSCDIPLTLGSLGPGDYVVLVTARRGDEQVDHYVPLRVSR